MPDTRLTLALAVAVLPACLDTSPTPKVGTTTHEVNDPVDWENMVNVQTIGSGNGLSKNGGMDDVWDAGATSEQSIGGHGFVRFTTDEDDLEKAIGLSSGSAGQHITDIDYAIRLGSDGIAWAVENGTNVFSLGEYEPGYLFQVEATPDSINYKKNDGTGYQTLHTTNVAAGLDFPLLVDTSLRDSGATLVNVVVNEEPKIHVAVQGGFLVPGALDCGRPDAMTIHGSALLQWDPDVPAYNTLDEFEDTLPTTVEQSLRDYLENNDVSDPEDITGIVILDIEKKSNPSDLWGNMDAEGEPDLRTDNQKRRIITGLKNRIIGARAVFPQAKLALYGTLIPDLNGEEDGVEYGHRRDALVFANGEGLFDDLDWEAEWGTTPNACPGDLCPGLDYLAPVVYPRFGCNPDDCELTPTAGYPVLDDYTQLAISGSREIGSLPLLPLMSVRIHNLNSDYHHHLIRDLDLPENYSDPDDPFFSNLTVQMDVFRDEDIADVVLWVGGNTTQVLPQPNEGPNDNCPTGVCWKVNDYTCWM